MAAVQSRSQHSQPPMAAAGLRKKEERGHRPIGPDPQEKGLSPGKPRAENCGPMGIRSRIRGRKVILAASAHATTLGQPQVFPHLGTGKRTVKLPNSYVFSGRATKAGAPEIMGRLICAVASKRFRRTMRALRSTHGLPPRFAKGELRCPPPHADAPATPWRRRARGPTPELFQPKGRTQRRGHAWRPCPILLCVGFTATQSHAKAKSAALPPAIARRLSLCDHHPGAPIARCAVST